MATGGKKNLETSSTASAMDKDPQIRTLLDAMQKQNEKHEKQMNEMRQALRAANEENKKRVQKIEVLGRSLAGMQLGEDTILTDDFTSIASNNEMQGTIRKGELLQKRPDHFQKIHRVTKNWPPLNLPNNHTFEPRMLYATSPL